MDTVFKRPVSEPKILVSAPKSNHLSAEQEQFLTELHNKVTDADLRLVDIDGILPLVDQAREIRQLQGVIVVAFAQWTGQRLVREKDKATFPTEFNHLYLALATAAGKPLLVLREKSVDERGALRPTLGCRTVKIPESLRSNWLSEEKFDKQFQMWLTDVKSKRDVFLGYCSKSAGTAAQIQVRLQRLGATVVDWAMDFRAGASILNEIERYRVLCTCGIFLFTEDDPLEDRNEGAAPRDNVVFEAGYFMSSKGADRCLIIREGNAKMPADLGGEVYVPLEKGADVSTIEVRLAKFLQENL